MNIQDPISTIMIKKVETLKASESMMDVAYLFDRRHIHHIPIVDGDRLIGLISKSDFNSFRIPTTDEASVEKEKNRLKNQVISAVMHDLLTTLKPDDTIESAIRIFKKNFIHAIPITEDGILKGIVYTT